MNEHRSTPRNGSPREAPSRPAPTDGHSREPLGHVARDVMDHISMIARDRAKIARLEVTRYGEHLRTDIAPKAMWGTATAVTALLAVTCGLLALFLGIAWALGSVAWTFLIFAGIFTVGAVVAAGFVKRPPRVETSDEIARRFPSVRGSEGMPQHALVRQATPAGHQEVTREAQIEASREILTSSEAVAVLPEDEARHLGVHDGEAREFSTRSNGRGAPTTMHR